MAVSDVVSLLGGSSSLTTIQAATPGGFSVPQDSAAELVSRLKHLGCVLAVTAVDEVELPSIVHSLVGVTPVKVDSYNVAQVDSYILELRNSSFDGLTEMYQDAITALEASAYSIEPTDLRLDYDDDQKYYLAEMAVEVGYPTIDNVDLDALPVATVFLDSRSADGIEDSYDAQQRVHSFYSVILITSNGDLETLRDDVMTQLLGKTTDPVRHDMQYVGGELVGAFGSLEIWRENYRDYQYYTET